MNYKQLLMALTYSFVGGTCYAMDLLVKPATKPLPKAYGRVAQAVIEEPPVTLIERQRPNARSLDRQESGYLDEDSADAYTQSAELVYRNPSSIDALCQAIADDGLSEDNADEIPGKRSAFARPESAYIHTEEMEDLRNDLRQNLPTRAAAPASYETYQQKTNRELGEAIKGAVGKAGILVVRDKPQQGPSSEVDAQKSPRTISPRVAPPYQAPVPAAAVKSSKERRLNKGAPRPEVSVSQKNPGSAYPRVSVVPRFLPLDEGIVPAVQYESDPPLDAQHENVKEILDSEILSDEEDLYSVTINDPDIPVVAHKKPASEWKPRSSNQTESFRHYEATPAQGSGKSQRSPRKGIKSTAEKAVKTAEISAPIRSEQKTPTFVPNEAEDPQRRSKKAYIVCFLKLTPAPGFIVPEYSAILGEFRSHLNNLKAEGHLDDVDIDAEEKDQTDWFFYRFLNYIKLMGFGISE